MDTANEQPIKDDVTAEQTPAAPTELQMLKERAKLMDIKFSNAIGVDALKAKIAAKLAGEADNTNEDGAEVVSPVQEAPVPLAPTAAPTPPDEPKLNPLEGDVAGKKPAAVMTERERVLADSMKLVRCRVTNMNPAKGNLHGEMFTVANKFIGTVKKFVPYGEATDDGYHMPNVIYEDLASRKFLQIRTVKDKRTGVERVESTWVREFSLEVLPQLTQEELNRLAIAQAAAGSVD